MLPVQPSRCLRRSSPGGSDEAAGSACVYPRSPARMLSSRITPVLKPRHETPVRVRLPPIPRGHRVRLRWMMHQVPQLSTWKYHYRRQDQDGAKSTKTNGNDYRGPSKFDQDCRVQLLSTRITPSTPSDLVSSRPPRVRLHDRNTSSLYHYRHKNRVRHVRRPKVPFGCAKFDYMDRQVPPLMTRTATKPEP